MTVGTVVPFVTIAFGLAWGLIAVLILFTAIVFVAGIGEPSHKDIIDRKKRRPF